jgi:hypothetical protein
MLCQQEPPQRFARRWPAGHEVVPGNLATSAHENEARWSRSVPPTAGTETGDRTFGDILSIDSLSLVVRFPTSTSNVTSRIISRASPCTTFACGTFWRRNPMSRSSSSTSVRLLDLGIPLATVPIPAPTSRTSSSGRIHAADISWSVFRRIQGNAVQSQGLH